jgi:4-diphosphocytidyl-2C-methyl-D-erythritol kinase
MDIDVMFRLLLLLMLDGIKPWPISGRAAVAIGNEAVRAKTTTTNMMVAMATDVEVSDMNAFNRGMKTVSSSTCEREPIKKKRKENKKRVNWFRQNKFLLIIAVRCLEVQKQKKAGWRMRENNNNKTKQEQRCNFLHT